jgi:hypothetical protein
MGRAHILCDRGQLTLFENDRCTKIGKQYPPLKPVKKTEVILTFV